MENGRLRGKHFFPKDYRQYGIMAEFVGTVVFVVSSEDLVDHLQQVLFICMDAEQCRGICLKIVLSIFSPTKVQRNFFNNNYDHTDTLSPYGVSAGYSNELFLEERHVKEAMQLFSLLTESVTIIVLPEIVCKYEKEKQK